MGVITPGPYPLDCHENGLNLGCFCFFEFLGGLARASVGVLNRFVGEQVETDRFVVPSPNCTNDAELLF